jgi:hypothetical protein
MDKNGGFQAVLEAAAQVQCHLAPELTLADCDKKNGAELSPRVHKAAGS